MGKPIGPFFFSARRRFSIWEPGHLAIFDRAIGDGQWNGQLAMFDCE